MAHQHAHTFFNTYTRKLTGSFIPPDEQTGENMDPGLPSHVVWDTVYSTQSITNEKVMYGKAC